MVVGRKRGKLTKITEEKRNDRGIPPARSRQHARKSDHFFPSPAELVAGTDRIRG